MTLELKDSSGWRFGNRLGKQKLGDESAGDTPDSAEMGSGRGRSHLSGEKWSDSDVL